jgi:protein pelota
MQIKHRAFQKDGAGSVKVVADDDEDIWHLYNLIMEGDEIRASTSRKVQVKFSTDRKLAQPCA